MTSKKIRIVTDSTCDLPGDLIEKYRIGVVPCFVNYGGKSYADDGVALTREDYYTELPKIHPLPTTSAPPPGLAERIIREAAEDADHLIVITVAAKLSGVYNALRLGTNGLPPESVTLIDSTTTTMGLGWQVLVGAETAEATGDLAATLDAMSRVRASQRVYAGLSTLEYLRQGGRVSWAAAGIGALLQIKPIIEVRESEIHSLARVRTFSRAVEELVRLGNEQAPLDRLAILHVGALEAAHDLHERLRDVAPPDTLFVNVTPAIGTHIGPGGLGIVTVSQSWKV